MTPELLVLTLAGFLQMIQYGLMAVPANRELGPSKTMSPRDADQVGDGMEAQVSRRTGRLIRALDNHFEALILFTLAVVVVTLTGASNWFTTACAWVYLIARILYVPAYAFGWVPWRSIIFGIGFLATAMMLVAALIAG